MGRIKRVYYANAVYHVYNHGNNRNKVFVEDQDKINFLEVLAQYKERFGFRIYGLMILDNHFHLVVETKQVNNISKVMQAVFLSYGNKYRKRYSYRGHLWESRFQSRIIEGEKYILACIDYIHNNPVKVGVVAEAKDYPWSSYFIYSGLDNKQKVKDQ